tara:strand:+ start:127 stop:288 length:162 start_codon:yes stop_codon:yes gene_type:complete
LLIGNPKIVPIREPTIHNEAALKIPYKIEDAKDIIIVAQYGFPYDNKRNRFFI